MHGTDLMFVREDPASNTARALIASLDAELSERYPEDGATHFELHPEEVEEGKGTFLVAYRGDEPVACGALRCISEHTAEIKRMFVAPNARRHGVAHQLLASLEAEAKRMGVQRLVLETGDRQPEALSLYGRHGFRRIEAFGVYVDSPLSVCMGKEL